MITAILLVALLVLVALVAAVVEIKAPSNINMLSLRDREQEK
jgi:hypothetical protein